MSMAHNAWRRSFLMTCATLLMVCADMCAHVYRPVYRHTYRHVYRHEYRCVYRHACRHAHRHACVCPKPFPFQRQLRFKQLSHMYTHAYTHVYTHACPHVYAHDRVYEVGGFVVSLAEVEHCILRAPLSPPRSWLAFFRHVAWNIASNVPSNVPPIVPSFTARCTAPMPHACCAACCSHVLHGIAVCPNGLPTSLVAGWRCVMPRRE